MYVKTCGGMVICPLFFEPLGVTYMFFLATMKARNFFKMQTEIVTLKWLVSEDLFFLKLKTFKKKITRGGTAVISLRVCSNHCKNLYVEVIQCLRQTRENEYSAESMICENRITSELVHLTQTQNLKFMTSAGMHPVIQQVVSFPNYHGSASHSAMTINHKCHSILKKWLNIALVAPKLISKLMC